MFVCDGVGIHITCDFLGYIIDKGWVLVLRTPFCSYVLQNEDLVSFWALKYVTRARAINTRARHARACWSCYFDPEHERAHVANM